MFISLNNMATVVSMAAASLPIVAAAPVSDDSLSASNLDSAGTIHSPAVSYNNTLALQRADPQIIKHTDGWYYFTATVPDYDQVILRRAETIQGLQDAEEVVIFQQKESGVGSGYIWAPELHYINGKWYIYVAFGADDQWRIRPAVLEGTGDNPLEAEWAEKGVVETNWDTFSLDMTTFTAGDVRYAVWAQEDPTWNDTNTALFIAPMTSPWELKLPAVAVTYPDLEWERIGHNVNEGAYVIKRAGTIFLTYSASATDYNYCIGLLSASEDADLTNPFSWTKSQDPVFVSNSETSQWGPGHNAFTVSEDGLSDVFVYHDRGYRDIDGEPLNDPNRRSRVQKLYWRADGTPDFGIPVPDGWTPVRLRVAGYEVKYVRNEGVGEQAAVVNEAENPALAETQFRIVDPGFGGEGTVSLESTNLPGRFLRRSEGQVVLAVDDESEGFRADASFTQGQGLSDEAGVSFGVPDSGEHITVGGGNGLVVGQVAEGAEGLATFFTE